MYQPRCHVHFRIRLPVSKHNCSLFYKITIWSLRKKCILGVFNKKLMSTVITLYINFKLLIKIGNLNFLFPKDFIKQ